MVGRPRKFDMEHVLNLAMETFWAKGYEATSMADLMAATGLHKGSIYQAFGSKHELFIAALRRYLEIMRQEKNETLSRANSPLEGIRLVAHNMLDRMDGHSSCPKGCMVVNTIVELAPHDPEVEKILNEHTGLMQSSLIDAVTQGQMAGQINTSKPPEAIAMLMMTFMTGLAAVVKSSVTKEQAHQLLDMQLESIT